ncbi:M42 family metallopeptidase [Tepidanaerobacter sp. EBM-49]|uniref:M42 family metallopeptidase n=1 Tax=Tepidanaerobacter sp. EBM-49 TaxID=1918504 RepID=UPI000AFA7DB5|nr:M42 family metallopeptidase [Tepidanaerobacter sp. EBM-49]
MVELLKRLTETDGVSGNENKIRELIKEEITPYVDNIHIDSMGNLIAFKKGTKEHPKKIMLDAHMDEVGLIITYICDNGMLKFGTIGIDQRVLLSKRVLIGGKVFGVIGVKAIHLQEKSERENVIKQENMYIDIGASSKEEAEKLVKLGDYAAFTTEFEEIGNGKIKAKALDDRAGCGVLIETLKESYPDDIYACFAVQEEVGLRGAMTASYKINPDIGIAIEGTTCSDVPGADEHMYSTVMGIGPAISIIDRSSYSSKEIVSSLIDTAESCNIPYQIKRTMTGGNDAGIIQLAHEGVRTGVVSVPVRYIHSPVSMMDIKDYENTIKLIKEFLRKGVL